MSRKLPNASETSPVSPVLCGEQEQGQHLGLGDWGIGRHSLGHKEQEKQEIESEFETSICQKEETVSEGRNGISPSGGCNG